MTFDQMIAVGRSFAYSIHDQFDNDTEAGKRLGDLKHSVINIMVSEFWNALDRNLMHRDHVEPAIAITHAYLKWYRKGGHILELPVPEWGVEYK